MSVDVTLPELAENIEKARVTSVLVQQGARVTADQPIVELESDKATVEVPTTTAGVVTGVHVRPGDEVRVGQPLVTVDPERAPVEPERVRDESPTETVPAAPTTRRLARELGVDLREVRGASPSRRISEADLLAFVRRRLEGTRPPEARAYTERQVRPPLPDFERWGEITREPLDAIRRRTAEVVARAWSEIPHVAQFDRADITRLEAMRAELTRERENGRTPRPTITAVLVHVVANVLRRSPQFNASLDVARAELVLKHHIHIGVAVDTARGLLVPVIRDADKKNLAAIAMELDDFAQRARNGRLSPSEMQGGSFTITNLGSLGTTAFAPVIRWPEVAILGVGRAEHQPVFDGKTFAPRNMLPLCLSYDHRIADGADAGRFLRALAELLENPLRIIIEG